MKNCRMLKNENTGQIIFQKERTEEITIETIHENVPNKMIIAFRLKELKECQTQRIKVTYIKANHCTISRSGLNEVLEISRETNNKTEHMCIFRIMYQEVFEPLNSYTRS